MREEIAADGSVGAWIRSGKPSAEEERARKTQMNALAVKYEMNPPYPEIDNDTTEPGL